MACEGHGKGNRNSVRRCFARQRIIRTSTRCPSTIRRDALPCGRSCTRSSQHTRSQFPGRLRGRTTVSGAASVLLACSLAYLLACLLARPRLHARAAVQKERADSAGRGSVAVSKLGRPGTRANCSLCVAAQLDLTHCFILLEGERTQCTHSAPNPQHVLSAGLSPACPPTCALLAHCAPTAHAHCSRPLLKPSLTAAQHVVHHAPDR